MLLQGPAVRALAAGSDRVTMLCGPRGRAAAELLPGVDGVVELEAPWILHDPPPVDEGRIREVIDRVRSLRADEAVIFTSHHQSALPTALVLRMAGVPRIGAISEDYPGSLLDVRHRPPDGLHEVERSLSLASAMGYRLPPGDDARLRMRAGAPLPGLPGGYVVLHPGAAAPARTWPASGFRELARRLAWRGTPVVVTGSAAEGELVRDVAAGQPGVIALAGAVDLAGLAAVLAGAATVVCGNTGPAHIAAAVGTPIVSLFAPVVPSERWRPWAVPHVLLGDQGAACAGTRARECPVPGHPCLAGVAAADVLDAIDRLTGTPRMEAATA